MKKLGELDQLSRKSCLVLLPPNSTVRPIASFTYYCFADVLENLQDSRKEEPKRKYLSYGCRLPPCNQVFLAEKTECSNKQFWAGSEEAMPHIKTVQCGRLVAASNIQVVYKQCTLYKKYTSRVLCTSNIQVVCKQYTSCVQCTSNIQGIYKQYTSNIQAVYIVQAAYKQCTSRLPAIYKLFSS